MEDLIKALQIFIKYENSEWPTWCEHDALHICDITADRVTKEDLEELERLGFIPDGDEGFVSFRYGSA